MIHDVRRRELAVEAASVARGHLGAAGQVVGESGIEDPPPVAERLGVFFANPTPAVGRNVEDQVAAAPTDS